MAIKEGEAFLDKENYHYAKSLKLVLYQTIPHQLKDTKISHTIGHKIGHCYCW